MQIHCQAPAKIILSGEHAVVQGAPGLSMAIDLPTHSTLTHTPSETNFIEIELIDYQQKHAFPEQIWHKLASNIEGRFQLYQDNVSSITQVLQHPIDLILITLYHFHSFQRIKSGHLTLQIRSHGLAERGLGSSAAVVTSLLSALFKLHDLYTLPQAKDEILILAQFIETRQHGTSSGIDPTTTLLGGLLRYQQNHPTQKLPPAAFNAWLIDTGKPQSTTGQCVDFVQQHYPKAHPIWLEFEKTTQQIQTAWLEEDTQKLKQNIKINQNLLTQIGVVPKKIQTFITELETQTNAIAKICGAGAITGNAAGMILCLSSQAPTQICTNFGYKIIPLCFQPKGCFCEMAN